MGVPCIVTRPYIVTCQSWFRSKFDAMRGADLGFLKPFTILFADFPDVYNKFWNVQTVCFGWAWGRRSQKEGYTLQTTVEKMHLYPSHSINSRFHHTNSGTPRLLLSSLSLEGQHTHIGHPRNSCTAFSKWKDSTLAPTTSTALAKLCFRQTDIRSRRRVSNCSRSGVRICGRRSCDGMWTFTLDSSAISGGIEHYLLEELLQSHWPVIDSIHIQCILLSSPVGSPWCSVGGETPAIPCSETKHLLHHCQMSSCGLGGSVEDCSSPPQWKNREYREHREHREHSETQGTQQIQRTQGTQQNREYREHTQFSLITPHRLLLYILWVRVLIL